MILDYNEKMKERNRAFVLKHLRCPLLGVADRVVVATARFHLYFKAPLDPDVHRIAKRCRTPRGSDFACPGAECGRLRLAYFRAKTPPTGSHKRGFRMR